MVSCDVTGGITLGTKLKMPIFTLYLPHNLLTYWCFRSLCVRDMVSNKSYQNFCDKSWSDQEVNTQFDKDLNP